MNKAKKIFYTVAASFAVGAIAGMLYAPDKGAETRRKISKLKQKFHFGKNGEIDNYDRETLEELSIALKEQLNKIDERLAKDAG